MIRQCAHNIPLISPRQSYQIIKLVRLSTLNVAKVLPALFSSSSLLLADSSSPSFFIAGASQGMISPFGPAVAWLGEEELLPLCT